MKRDDNPDGVERSVVDNIVTKLQAERTDFLKTFGKHFFSGGMLSRPVSDATLNRALSMALPASQKATVDCVRALNETDFRQDLKSLSVPTLIIHGDKYGRSRSKSAARAPRKRSGTRRTRCTTAHHTPVHDR